MFLDCWFRSSGHAAHVGISSFELRVLCLYGYNLPFAAKTSFFLLLADTALVEGVNHLTLMFLVDTPEIQS